MRKIVRPIGEILVDLGRITPDDVQRALAYQRERGGYFGNALVDLGLVTQAEVEWGLADQYDLPFVQLRPEAIDRATAARVPAAWAREHLVLPVLRSGDTVTAIVADPRAAERLDEVRRFTGASRVEAALASIDNILLLIDSLGEGETRPPATPLAEWVEGAVRGGARELMISIRGAEAFGRSDAEPGAVRPLDGAGPEGVERFLGPSAPVGEPGAPGVNCWRALLDTGAGLWIAECRAVRAAGAAEWRIELRERVPGGSSGPAADEALRLRVREGAERAPVAVCVVDGEVAPDVAATLLPRLPTALLGPGCRSVHLGPSGSPVPRGVLCVAPEPSLTDALAALEPFRFDAVTLGSFDPQPDVLAAACRAARVVAFRGTGSAGEVIVTLDLNRGEGVWILAKDERGPD